MSEGKIQLNEPKQPGLVAKASRKILCPEAFMLDGKPLDLTPGDRAEVQRLLNQWREEGKR